MFFYQFQKELKNQLKSSKMVFDNDDDMKSFSYTDANGNVLDCKRHQLFNTTELIDKFGWEEYSVFSLMLMISILIGVFFWWKGQNNNAEYMMGGKNMGTFPMTMSLIARLAISYFFDYNK